VSTSSRRLPRVLGLFDVANYFATVAVALPAATYTLDLFAPALSQQPASTALFAILWLTASTALRYVGMRPTAFATALFLIGEFVVVLASAIAALLAYPRPEAYNGLTPCAQLVSPPLSFGGFATAGSARHDGGRSFSSP